MSSTVETIKAFVNPIKRRILLMFARGILQAVNDQGGIQVVKLDLMSDETREIERMQDYGLATNPPLSSDALVAFAGGVRSQGMVLRIADKDSRPTGLAPGETKLYSNNGDYIYLKDGNIIEVVSSTKVKVTAPEVEVIAATKVTLTTPLVETSSNLHVKGALTVDGVATAASVASTGNIASSAGSVSDSAGSLSTMRTKYNAHHHPETGTTTGTTDNPM